MKNQNIHYLDAFLNICVYLNTRRCQRKFVCNALRYCSSQHLNLTLWCFAAEKPSDVLMSPVSDVNVDLDFGSNLHLEKRNILVIYPNSTQKEINVHLFYTET